MIQVPCIEATGGWVTCCRKSILSPTGSSSRREVQALTSPLAMAQIRIRSKSGPCSTWSTWMVGGNTCGQLTTSAISRYTSLAGTSTLIVCSTSR
jgi:hypothetical protein